MRTHRGGAPLRVGEACSLILLLALAIVLPAASAQCVKLPEFDGVLLRYRKATSATQPITWVDIDVLDDEDVPTVVPKNVIGNYSCEGKQILLVDGEPLEPYLIYVCDTDPTNPKRSAYDPEPPTSTLSCAVEIPYSPAPPPSPYPPTVYPPPPSPPRPRCLGDHTDCGTRECCKPDQMCHPKANEGKGVCCAANTTPCGTLTCCEDREDVVCFPKARYEFGLCCSSNQTACGSNCCDPGQLCIKVPLVAQYIQRCCDPDKVCGSDCCRAGTTCMTDAKNGVKLCCPQGSSPCGQGRLAQRCCKSNAVCHADYGYPLGVGLCCPPTHEPCPFDSCCGPDQECVQEANFFVGGCCPKGLGCYWGCCKEGEVCTGKKELSRCCDAEGNKCYTPRGRTPDFR